MCRWQHRCLQPQRHGSPYRLNWLGPSSPPGEAECFQVPSFSVYIAVVILILANFCAYPDIFLQCRSAYSCHRAMEIAPGVGAGGRPAPDLGYCKHLRPVFHALGHRVLCAGPSVCILRLRLRRSHAVRDYSQGGVRWLPNGREALATAERHAVAGTRLLSREHCSLSA